MKEYVVTFVFDADLAKVVLLEKKRGPEALVGLWNGVGGKVERGEYLEEAAIREFAEEAGVVLPSVLYVGVYGNEHFTVHIMTTQLYDLTPVKQMEEERVQIFPLDNLPDSAIMAPGSLDMLQLSHAFLSEIRAEAAGHVLN